MRIQRLIGRLCPQSSFSAILLEIYFINECSFHNHICVLILER